MSQSPHAVHYFLAARECEISRLDNVLQAGKLIGQLSHFVHVLQRERGSSNIWLCSEGLLFGEELAHRAAAVSQSMNNLFADLPALPPASALQPGAFRVYHRIGSMLMALESLPELRNQIHQRSISHQQAMQSFNTIIQQVLNLVYEVADIDADGQVASALVALFTFMQGKEYAGQERALASAGFASRNFSDSGRQLMVELIAAQESCLTSFAGFADTGILATWLQQEGKSSEFERLRRLACTGAPGEEDTVLNWFALASQRLDLMKIVEDKLINKVMHLCQQSLLRVQSSNTDDPQTLAGVIVPAEKPVAAYFAATPHNEADEDTGLPPQLNRSLLNLIQHQAHRLKTLDNELAGLRATLMERKTIEQAKALLMQYQGLTEEQAWHLLRKTAMNQNKKVVEIAQAMLDVSTVFTSSP
ncbi:nitrate regulatory protein [Mangrovibacter plantisponsor]|uniref:ANTAR domain-containing protein n=1 Tax=Mangrovibacter plantisponsor TaxID=451513 RepID=A0A317Q6L9_9ENTR|nr:nitrate regulatory protein [Mangrovibacter plantisponsor]PWW10881.1 ANTAR domain-containing protein [Mangrovibacter plantisponsor]